MQLGNAVDTVRGDDGQIGHAHLIIVNDAHTVNIVLVVMIRFAQQLAEAAVDLLHDHIDTRKQVAEDVLVPLFERLGHDGMVGIGEGIRHDPPCLIPPVAAVVKQHAHQFGDGERGMRVVDLDSILFAKIVKRAVKRQMAAHNI